MFEDFLDLIENIFSLNIKYPEGIISSIDLVFLRTYVCCSYIYIYMGISTVQRISTWFILNDMHFLLFVESEYAFVFSLDLLSAPRSSFHQ
jgi:hypothetical protein